VREWLAAGVGEVCLAVADEQTDGRGRLDRVWQASPGRALLLSAGFRPADLKASHGWRLAAISSLAMLAAATSLLGPTADRLALKWPNDIIAVHHGRLRKVAGVLSEASLQGERVVSAVVGIGVNVDWAAADYPADLADTMWSLSEASGRRRIDRDALLAAWLERPTTIRTLGSTMVSAAWAPVTPGVSGRAKVAMPEPAEANSESTCPW